MRRKPIETLWQDGDDYQPREVGSGGVYIVNDDYNLFYETQEDVIHHLLTEPKAFGVPQRVRLIENLGYEKWGISFGDDPDENEWDYIVFSVRFVEVYITKP